MNRFEAFNMVELREIQQAFAMRKVSEALFAELLEVIHEREDELERMEAEQEAE